ncbi:unnamed protein product [Alopecurus aequalis]
MAKAPHPSGWSTKRYILAALVGTLTITIVVITVSSILRPAEIFFSVTDASTSSNGSLSLTVTANNTSDRSSVQYRSLIVYLQFAQDGTSYKVPVGVDGPPPLLQPPGTPANISLSCSLWATKLPSGGTPMISVLVLVVVRFKVGMAYSRPYEVRVSCGPVDFVGGRILSFPMACNP